MDRFTSQTTRRHRAAITAVFAGNGILFASLFSRLPEIQERLGLDEGALGLVLLAAPAGLVGAVVLAGAQVARVGSRRVAAISAAAYAGVLFLPSLAPNAALLALALFALGASSGGLDVAMNTQGIAIERRYPRRIFASLHAGFSFGALAGAAAGGLVAQAGIPLTAHLVGVGAIVAAVMALAIRRFVPDGEPASQRDEARRGVPRRSDGTPVARDEAPAEGRRAAPTAGDEAAPPRAGGSTPAPPLVRPSRALVPLGAVAFCVLLAEGALNDWSAVYLARVHDAAPATAAAGLAVFSLTMGGARLVGDRLAAACGTRAVARGGLVIGAAGFAAAAVAPSPIAAIVAFAGLGLGLASVYPFTMRAAGERRDVPAGVAIGAVTTLGYVGFLLGPPLVGLLAHVTSLRGALATVGGLCLPAAWLAQAVTDESTRRSESEHVWECPPPARSSARISS